MIIQGTSDDNVPYELTRKAYNLISNNKKKLIEIESAPHDFKGDHVKEFIKHTIGWLKLYLLEIE